ncbi:MAG: murein biosynthesis integral membrane protein MurJ, partial [Candidatus Cloacimonetes bacterium]|nr:murein biosynthesis integral membrane protein MurJ [Candidatus Cloacimonadota bacterium]
MSKNRIARNTGSMSLGVLISRVFGLIRDIVMTNYFGTSYAADAFQAAFQIPNLLRKLFGEGALSAAFVPIYNEIGIKRGFAAQFKFAVNVLSFLTTILLIICLLGIILAPWLVRLLAPGFNEITYLLALKLVRIMFPYLMLIGLSSTLISILNSHDYYFIPGLTSAFLNVAMFGSLLIFINLTGETDLARLAVVWSWGVVLGGILQTVVNFPLLARIGYRFGINFRTGSEALKALWQRFIPGAVGLAIRQINLAVDLILASLLVTGSLAALNYGNRLMQLPLGIFGVSAGVAVLPLFSRQIAGREWKTLSENLRFALVAVTFIMLPLTAVIAGLGEDVVRIVFQRGAFDQTSLIMTNRALVCYALGLVFFSVNRILIPVFYANGDTLTPVRISVVIVVLNIVLNLILMQFLQHAGLALATSLSALVQTFLLIRYLKKKIPEIEFHKYTGNIRKIFLLSLFIF